MLSVLCLLCLVLVAFAFLFCLLLPAFVCSGLMAYGLGLQLSSWSLRLGTFCAVLCFVLFCFVLFCFVCFYLLLLAFLCSGLKV